MFTDGKRCERLLFKIVNAEAASPLTAKRRREKRSSFEDGEMPSRSSPAVRLISSGSRADQHVGHVSSFTNCEKDEVGKQETRASEKGDEREEQGDRTESIPPSRPKRREDEKAEKIEVELPGPSQLRHVSEKNR